MSIQSATVPPSGPVIGAPSRYPFQAQLKYTPGAAQLASSGLEQRLAVLGSTIEHGM